MKSFETPSLPTIVAVIVMAVTVSSHANAQCTSPHGAEGQIFYNSTHKVAQFCNGTAWVNMTAVGGNNMPPAGCDPGDTITWNGTWVCSSSNGDSGPDDCVDTIIEWGAGCSAPSNTLSHGQSTTVANTAPGYTGARDLTCNDGTIEQTGGSCSAQPQNEFTPAANLPQWVMYHTAAPLADGRALICGGFTLPGGTATNRCDIYDPTTNAFTQVADLPQARYFHIAAPLAGGRVLICGGLTSGGSLTKRCDIYNPGTNAFTQVADLPLSTFDQSAASLADGRVLICGGYTNRCDVYDPATDAYTQVAGMSEMRYTHRATTLANGHVLICGGRMVADLNHCETYNPTTNSFTQVADLPQAKRLHTAAPLADGRVLICGGQTDFTLTDRCDIYNPATNSFTQVANLPQAQSGQSAVPLADGRVLLCGGYSQNCHIYTP